MTLQYRIVFSILLLFAGQRSSLAESKPLKLKWTELAPIIHGHRVELVLKQGLKIKGEAVVVREDSLVMDVKEGSAVIPRIDMGLLKLERPRANWRRNRTPTHG